MDRLSHILQQNKRTLTRYFNQVASIFLLDFGFMIVLTFRSSFVETKIQRLIPRNMHNQGHYFSITARKRGGEQ